MYKLHMKLGKKYTVKDGANTLRAPVGGRQMTKNNGGKRP